MPLVAYQTAWCWCRLTRWFCEKVAQNVAQQIFGQNKYITFTEEKIAQK
jgi:hypothetical protein